MMPEATRDRSRRTTVEGLTPDGQAEASLNAAGLADHAVSDSKGPPLLVATTVDLAWPQQLGFARATPTARSPFARRAAVPTMPTASRKTMTEAYSACFVLAPMACQSLDCAKSSIGYATDTGERTQKTASPATPLAEIAIHCTQHLCTTSLAASKMRAATRLAVWFRLQGQGATRPTYQTRFADPGEPGRCARRALRFARAQAPLRSHAERDGETSGSREGRGSSLYSARPGAPPKWAPRQPAARDARRPLPELRRRGYEVFERGSGSTAV